MIEVDDSKGSGRQESGRKRKCCRQPQCMSKEAESEKNRAVLSLVV